MIELKKYNVLNIGKIELVLLCKIIGLNVGLLVIHCSDFL